MKIRILTPDSMCEFSADKVFLPGSYAPFEVLPGHAPIISTLERGEIRWSCGGEEGCMAIKAGAVRFAADEMTICAEADTKE